jgi:REP-associated tyrosine transposase
MARIARLVAPDLPHHITQRGNRRQETFFTSEDYETYLELMAHWCSLYGVEVWAYCLMPNHIHLIAVPRTEDSLKRAIGEAHRRYSRRVNFREKWRGHLWQGRFASFVMDRTYLLAAARYVERNPVRAGLVANPWDYRWSSAGSHLSGQDDILVRTLPLLEMVGDWRAFLSEELDPEDVRLLRRHENTGRPLGNDDFIYRLEAASGRTLRKGKPGPKPKIQRN